MFGVLSLLSLYTNRILDVVVSYPGQTANAFIYTIQVNDGIEDLREG